MGRLVVYLCFLGLLSCEPIKIENTKILYGENIQCNQYGCCYEVNQNLMVCNIDNFHESFFYLRTSY